MNQENMELEVKALFRITDQVATPTPTLIRTRVLAQLKTKEFRKRNRFFSKFGKWSWVLWPVAAGAALYFGVLKYAKPPEHMTVFVGDPFALVLKLTPEQQSKSHFVRVTIQEPEILKFKSQEYPDVGKLTSVTLGWPEPESAAGVSKEIVPVALISGRVGKAHVKTALEDQGGHLIGSFEFEIDIVERGSR